MTRITTTCDCGKKETTVVFGTRESNYRAEGTCAECVETTNRRNAVEAWASKERRRKCSK